MRFRRSELLLACYFVYVAALAVVRPLPPQTKWLTVALNAAIIGWFCLFAFAHAERGFRTLDYVRDWYPVPLLLLAYRQMGWIALPAPDRAFENYWIGFDRWLLDTAGLRAAIEALGPVGPNLLELSYLLVYGVPVFAVAVCYRGARQYLDDVYSLLLLGTLTAYAFYPFFPSIPPRLAFPEADLPMESLIRRLNWVILGNYSITASVFPSGHSAAAFAAAFGVRKYLPHRPRTGWALLMLAVLIATATIYGRYHFAIDTLAGLGTALFALAVSALWDRRAGRE